MNIYVFGNPDIEIDSLPVRLVPQLEKMFPDWTFTVLDPNEDWDVSGTMVIIDTVVNLTEPQVFEGLEHFMRAPRLTCHDFDAYANLQLLKKLGHIEDTVILGLPPRYEEAKAVAWLVEAMQGLS